jgi:hypothetical protein
LIEERIRADFVFLSFSELYWPEGLGAGILDVDLGHPRRWNQQQAEGEGCC